MSDSKVYLITGANRGIGRGLVEALAQRPNVTVIAAVRGLAQPTSQSLNTIPTASGSLVIPVYISNTDDKSSSEAITKLQSKHGITHLDTVVANAGISKWYSPIATTPLSEFRDHYDVNLVGTVALFQAVYPLLQKSKNGKFVAISTGAASIEGIKDFPMPAGAYFSSKASLNFVTRKIHFECEDLVAFSISPGWVQTDMGNFGAESVGLKEAPVTLEQSINGLLAKIDASTREKEGGTFESFDDTKYPW